MMGLEEVVENLAPRLLRYCLGCCGDAGTAEEAAQDSLAALVQRWRQSGPPDSPEAYAFTIARRRMGRMALRRRLVVPFEALGGHADPAPDPEQTAGEREQLGQVLQALGRLDSRDREAILLATVGELSLAAVAAVTGMSPGAAKTRVYRARRRLAAALGRGHDA